MALTIRVAASQGVNVNKAIKKSRQTHTSARPLTHIDLDKPGRLRVGHMLTIFGVSHSTLYAHIKRGLLPKPDGKDGARPYWSNETVKRSLET